MMKSPPPPAGIPDYDIQFVNPWHEADYILVMERWGNTFFELTPLDATGEPIAEANVLRFGYPTGTPYTLYDWNTGYANAIYETAQAYAFTVAKASKFFEGTTVPAQDRLVYGFRIDNDGEADVKFFGLEAGDVEPGTPDIDIAKNIEGPDSQTVVSGGRVTWTITVTNTGNVTLSNVTIGDELAVGCAAGNIGTLVPGQVHSYTCAEVNVTTGFVNVVTVVGTPPSGQNVTDNDPSTVVVVGDNGSSIDLEKLTNGEDADTPTGPLVSPGSTVTWTYVVTNTGTVPLSSILVTDSVEGPITCPQTSLAPGASMVCTLTGTAQAGQYANDAEVSGVAPDDTVVRDTDPSHYFGGLGTTAALGDRVWVDENRNGLQDEGEPGLPGVAVTLYDSGGNELSMTMTDADGFYRFEDLAPGSYIVGFAQPESFAFTEYDVDGNSQDARDSDARVPSLALNVGKPSQEVALGDRLTYALNVTNPDTEVTATNVVISATVPAGTTFVPGVSTPGWVCAGNATTAGTVCSFTVAQLAAGGQTSALFVVELGTDDEEVPEIINLFTDVSQTTPARTAPVTLAGGDVNLTLDAGLYLKSFVTTPTPRRPGPTNLEENEQPQARERLFLPALPNQ